jgi:hypothetical protein
MFNGRTEPCNGILVCDSQRVLKTLEGGNQKFKVTDEPVRIDGTNVVLDVLCPDWDILIEIQVALSQLPGLQLKFIKGHQDALTPYAQLPLTARLNVDAAAIAGKYQDLHGQDRPLVLLTSRTKFYSICWTVPSLPLSQPRSDMHIVDRLFWSTFEFEIIGPKQSFNRLIGRLM